MSREGYSEAQRIQLVDEPLEIHGWLRHSSSSQARRRAARGASERNEIREHRDTPDHPSDHDASFLPPATAVTATTCVVAEQELRGFPRGSNRRRE